VSLNARDDALTERAGDQILDTFIFAATRSLVDRVWCAGVKVVEGHLHVRRARIAAAYRAAIKRVLAA
jgi:hypothetical protein